MVTWLRTAARSFVRHTHRGRLLLAFAIIVPMLAPVHPDAISAAVDAPLALCTANSRIVSCVSGADVLLRGANIDGEHYQIGPGYDWSNGDERNAIPALRSWGANVLLQSVASGPILRDSTTNSRGRPVTRAQYLGFLDGVVAATRAQGMYVILAYRMPHVDVAQPPRPDEAAEAALAFLAGRYKDQPHVLYATQVEPHDVSWASLRPQWERVIDRIHEAAAPAKPLVMVSGPNHARDLRGAVSDPVNRPNVVYKAHYYGVKDRGFDELMALWTPAIDAGLPVFLGEFGPGDSQLLLDYTEARGIGWAAWHFWHEGHPTLVQNLSDFAPTAWGEQIKGALAAHAPPVSDALTIYDDGATNGFWEGAYGHRAKVGCDTSHKTSGNCSLAADLNGWGGFNFGYNGGYPTGGYAAITLDLRPNGQPLDNFQMIVDGPSGSRYGAVTLGAYQRALLVDGWVRVTIPLSTVGVAGGHLGKVQIQNNRGAIAPRVWLDHIALVKIAPIIWPHVTATRAYDAGREWPASARRCLVSSYSYRSRQQVGEGGASTPMMQHIGALLAKVEEVAPCRGEDMT